MGGGLVKLEMAQWPLCMGDGLVKLEMALWPLSKGGGLVKLEMAQWPLCMGMDLSSYVLQLDSMDFAYSNWLCQIAYSNLAP